MGCIDFNFNRAIDRDFVATGVVEPMQAISGAATFPQRVSGFVCDNGGEVVPGGALCCPLGSDRDENDRCVTPARTRVSPVGGTVQTLFNMAMQAPFLGRPVVGQARRMYTLFQSDLGATETSGSLVSRQWTRTGKIRWLALDKLEISTPDRVEPACTGYNDDCGRVNPGANSRGDVRVDGEVIPMDGPGRIAAAVVPSATESEVLMVARASRECPLRTRSDDFAFAYEDCDWSAPRFAIGRVADLEAPTGSLRSVSISGAPTRMSGVAIAAWSPADASPTRFFVVMRDAANNELSWSSCAADGTCSAAQPLLRDGVRVASEFSQIALSVQPTSNRLALVYSPQVIENPNRTLAVSEILGSGALRAESPRPVKAATPSREPVVMLRESAVSAAFTVAGNLTVGFENSRGQGLGTTLASPFAPGDVLLTVQNKDWNVSRGAVGVAVALPRRVQAFAPSPGNTYSVFLDDRPTHEALGVRPDGSRDSAFDGNFSGAVRGYGYVIYGGIVQEFFARLDGAALAPRYDYDESATLAYQLCNTIENSSRGLRAADTAVRSSSLGSASRLLCPGAADWPEPPVNRVLPELVWPPRRLRPGEDVERIAAIIAGDGWYSAPTHRPHSSPSNAVPPVPVDQCTLGNESAAWMHYELSRPQEGL
jgi:hypothetical protein